MDIFSNIPQYLPADSLLFFNNTKVIHARLRFKRQTGANIEIFCLSPVSPIDYQLSFSAQNSCTWFCMVGNLKKWKEDKLELAISSGTINTPLYAEQIKREGKDVIVKFSWDGPANFGELVEAAGTIPIPPYLNRDSEPVDKVRYQTIYSKFDGSVAAPTAGLHFTPEVLTRALKKGIQEYEITLHVGAGTFQPIKSESVLDHKMHGEYFSVPLSVIEKLGKYEGPIVATGTTTLRTLESLYWLAVKSLEQNIPVHTLRQWEYKNFQNTPLPKEVFSRFCLLLKKHKMTHFSANTEIMIIPGYNFKLVSGLITNFHQPESTLLMLISAFIGENWKKVYQFALDKDFRFLSYGDSSLLWKA